MPSTTFIGINVHDQYIPLLEGGVPFAPDELPLPGEPTGFARHIMGVNPLYAPGDGTASDEESDSSDGDEEQDESDGGDSSEYEMPDLEG